MLWVGGAHEIWVGGALQAPHRQSLLRSQARCALLSAATPREGRCRAFWCWPQRPARGAQARTRAVADQCSLADRCLTDRSALTRRCSLAVKSLVRGLVSDRGVYGTHQ